LVLCRERSQSRSRNLLNVPRTIYICGDLALACVTLTSCFFTEAKVVSKSLFLIFLLKRSFSQNIATSLTNASYYLLNNILPAVVACNDAATPTNGYRVCSNRNLLGSRCEFACNDYHRRVGALYTTCVRQPGGFLSWNNPAPRCERELRSGVSVNICCIHRITSLENVILIVCFLLNDFCCYSMLSLQDHRPLKVRWLQNPIIIKQSWNNIWI